MQLHINFHLVFANHALQRLTLFDGDTFEFVAIARGVFSAFTGVAFTADAVHRNGQGCVGFGADGTERHRTGCKALNNLRSRLDFVDRNRFAWINLEFKQTTQCQMALALVIDELCVFFVGAEIVGAGAVLQLGNRIRRPHMFFAAHTPCIFTASVETVGKHWVFAECRFVHANGFFGHFKNANTFHTAGCAGEILFHSLGVDTDRFEKLRAAIRHIG